MTRRTTVLVGLLVSLVLAAGVSYYASGSPDGLSKVAADNGLDSAEKDHPLDGTPLADYETSGVGDARLSRGLAGVLGVGVTFLVVGGLVFAVRRAGRRTRVADGEPGP